MKSRGLEQGVEVPARLVAVQRHFPAVGTVSPRCLGNEEHGSTRIAVRRSEDAHPAFHPRTQMTRMHTHDEALECFIAGACPSHTRSDVLHGSLPRGDESVAHLERRPDEVLPPY